MVKKKKNTIEKEILLRPAGGGSAPGGWLTLRTKEEGDFAGTGSCVYRVTPQHLSKHHTLLHLPLATPKVSPFKDQ